MSFSEIKVIPDKSICLETLDDFHLYIMGLSRHTTNFEDEGKRNFLNYIQASGHIF